jgi:multiple antibiotic resistance protein
MEWSDVASVARFTLVALSSVFFVVDPFATIPSFLALTESYSDARRRRTAGHAAWTCFLVLTTFALAGSVIFKIFGITLPAFKIAGGILLFLVAFEMLEARRSGTQEVIEERLEAQSKEQLGVTPLGIPMLAGPGSISTVMVLMGQSHDLWQAVPVFLAIAATSVASGLILAGASGVRGVLGETGIRILMRLMGLVLTAIAVQFVLNGLADVGVVPGAKAS